MAANGKSRIQLDLTPRQFEAIKEIQEHLDCNSYSEVFRRALVLMRKIVEMEKSSDGKQRFGHFNTETSEFHWIWFM